MSKQKHFIKAVRYLTLFFALGFAIILFNNPANAFASGEPSNILVIICKFGFGKCHSHKTVSECTGGGIHANCVTKCKQDDVGLINQSSSGSCEINAAHGESLTVMLFINDQYQAHERYSFSDNFIDVAHYKPGDYIVEYKPPFLRQRHKLSIYASRQTDPIDIRHLSVEEEIIQEAYINIEESPVVYGIVLILIVSFVFVIDIESHYERLINSDIARQFSNVGDRIYENATVTRSANWLLVFSLGPIILFYFNSPHWKVWLVQIYFCLIWAILVFNLVKQSRKLFVWGLEYGIMTLFLCFGLLIAITLMDGLFPLTSKVAVGGRTITYSIFEEFVKVMPLLIALDRGHIKNTNQGIFLGAMCGIGFSLGEGVLYIMSSEPFPSGLNNAFQILFRLMSGPLLHGALTGIIGSYIGHESARRTGRWVFVTLMIITVGLLHGLYNVFESENTIGLVVAFIIMNWFISRIQDNADRIEQRVAMH